jgi:hypothetical protein
MFALAVVTVLCLAGVAFCVRFMVALCKDYKPRQIVYGVDLRPISGQDPIAKLQPKEPVTRRVRRFEYAGNALSCSVVVNRMQTSTARGFLACELKKKRCSGWSHPPRSS